MDQPTDNESADLIADLLDPAYEPTKTFTEILTTGIEHAGGLAQLAQAEQDGTLFGPEAPRTPEKSP
ncbi:hypothetical protein VAR608DRAFT_4897 [Variovorax sp. HW608]|uniref:hypothetical protein n=1 Tax=Variovorax sp. HW608 TaxID=1034889 RepID=UPI00081FFD45|nr:hypothetical protein [Variovorax sp. HW608]SCK49217.1 hypothetical protein VAR608DRAFT_4897 [Variovorax sp. HW608]